MLKSGSYIVLGIGTEIGKTFLVENLCRKFPNANAIKPVVTGFSYQDENSDPAKILRALKREFSRKNISQISPWCYKKPVSPNFAGKISYSEVKDFCLREINIAKAKKSYLFIESAGGVMTPIDNQFTFLDLANHLKIPVFLVVANYLGSISHTLCAVEALKSKNIRIEKIILNEMKFNQNIKPISDYSLKKILKKLSKIEVISLKNFLKKVS